MNYFRMEKSLLLDYDDLLSVSLDEEVIDRPHWGWAIFWLLVFWPVVLVWVYLAMTRKKYIYHVTDHNLSKYGIIMDAKQRDEFTENCRIYNVPFIRED